MASGFLLYFSYGHGFEIEFVKAQEACITYPQSTEQHNADQCRIPVIVESPVIAGIKPRDNDFYLAVT